jgi:hypothetical protein
MRTETTTKHFMQQRQCYIIMASIPPPTTTLFCVSSTTNYTLQHHHIALALNSATVNPIAMREMDAETTRSEFGSRPEPQFKYFLNLPAEIRVKIYDLLLDPGTTKIIPLWWR